MPEDVIAAVTTEAPAPLTATEPAAPPLSPRESIVAKLKAHREALKAGGAPVAEPPAAVEGAPVADEPAVEPPKDADKDLELEHAKLLRKHSETADELREAREANKKAAAEATAFKALQASAKDDPVKSLAVFEKLMGRSFGDYSKWIVDNGDKVKNGRQYASLPDEAREKLERLDRLETERAEKTQTEAQQKALTDYTGNVSTWLKGNATDYPLASQFGFAAEQLAQEHGVGKVRPEHVKALEKRLEDNLLEVLTETTLRHLAGKNDKVKQVVAAVSATQPKSSPVTASPKGNQSGQAEGPRGLSNSNTSAAVVSEQLSGKEALKATLMDGMRRMREANR
jgi:hypothetical protein